MKRAVVAASALMLGLILVAAWWRQPSGAQDVKTPALQKPEKRRIVFEQAPPFEVRTQRPGVLPTREPSDPTVTEPSEDGITYVSASAPPDGIENTVWPVSKEGVRGALLEVAPLIKDCYDDALAEIPDLTGTMTVLFSITPRDGVGKVTRADLLEDQLMDAPIEECVLAAVESLQFDPPAEDGEAQVTWPFHFETQPSAP